MRYPPRPYPFTVILPNGELIEHRYGSDTFVETIERIGIERVKRLNLMYGNFPTHRHAFSPNRHTAAIWKILYQDAFCAL